jgi:hypothetical protein
MIEVGQHLDTLMSVLRFKLAQAFLQVHVRMRQTNISSARPVLDSK